MAEDPLRTRARITVLEQAFLALAASVQGDARERMSDRFEEAEAHMNDPLSQDMFGPDLDEEQRADFGRMAQEEWEWLKAQIFGRPAPAS